MSSGRSDTVPSAPPEDNRSATQNKGITIQPPATVIREEYVPHPYCESYALIQKQRGRYTRLLWDVRPQCTGTSRRVQEGLRRLQGRGYTVLVSPFVFCCNNIFYDLLTETSSKLNIVPPPPDNKAVVDKALRTQERRESSHPSKYQKYTKKRNKATENFFKT